MDDRDLEAAGETARVAGAVGLVRRRGEAELIVRDDVNRAAGVVAVEPRQVERLRDDALAGECGVAVNQHRQRQHAVEPWRSALVGDGACGSRHSDDDRIHRLQMARIRRHRHVRVTRRARRARAGVVLHVAHPAEVDAQRIGATGSLNSARICAYGFSRMCARTFSRPRCAMPMTAWRAPVIGRAGR